MSYPISWREMVRAAVNWAEEKYNATRVFRKSGFQPTATGDFPPTPILSITNIEHLVACSVELQDLIDAFHADENDTTRAALVAYLEAGLGETLEEAFPEAFADALATGVDQVVIAQVGSDRVQITIGLLGSVLIDGTGYTVTLEGTYAFDIEALGYSLSQPDAYKTGLNGANNGFATTRLESHEAHLGTGQIAYLTSFGSPHGQVTAGQKNPSRLLAVDPVSVRVPNFPTLGNPVRATFRYEGSSPVHGEFSRYDDGGFGDPVGTHTYSQIGPPIYFGCLLRSDAQVAAGHPLTDWWFQSGFLGTGPRDALTASNNSLARNSGATESAYIDSTHDAIEALRASLDSNTTGEEVSFEVSSSYSGWACFWWLHPTNGWYWKVPGVQGYTDDDAIGVQVPAATDISASEWGTAFNTMIGDAYVRWLSSALAEEGEYVVASTSAMPTEHQKTYAIGRGPWVRIAPGDPPESSEAGLVDAKCYTSQGW